MKRLIRRILAAVATLATVAGCGDNFAPSPDAPTQDLPREITMIAYPEAIADGEGSSYVAFVAYQDGDGLWQVMAGSRGTYKAVIKNERYGIAVGCSMQSTAQDRSSSIRIYYSTISETTRIEDDGCFSYKMTYPINGVTAGTVPSRLAIQTRNGRTTDVANGRFSLFERGEPTPVMAFEHAPDTPQVTKLLRAADANPGSDAPAVVDFDRLVAVESRNLTLRGGIGPYSIRSHLVVSGRHFLLPLNTRSPNTYPAMPQAVLRTGDVIRVTATDNGGEAQRFASTYLSSLEDAELAFLEFFHVEVAVVGDDAPSPVVSFAAGGRRQLQFVEYTAHLSTVVGQGGSSFNVRISQGWLGSDSAATYRPPDLTTIPGWSEEMSLRPRTRVTWLFSRSEFSTRDLVVGRSFQDVTYMGSTGSYCGNGKVEAAYEQCDPPNGTTCSAMCRSQTATSSGAQQALLQQPSREATCWLRSHNEPCI